jgi:hypothetical protein
MENVGRLLIIGGVILILIGGAVLLAAKFGLPIGHLPGDIRIEGKNWTVYFPLATMILLSIVLTILVNLIGRLLNK